MRSSSCRHWLRTFIPALAVICACGSSAHDDPEQWAALLDEHPVFTGALTMRCGDGPEDFEYRNSTLLLPLQVALALDGRVLSGRIWSLSEEQASPPAKLTGRLASGGAKLSLAQDEPFELGELSTLLELELRAVHERAGLLIGDVSATFEKTQGEEVYLCALSGELQLEPDRFAPNVNAFASQGSAGAVEVWFDEPVNVAALEVSVESQGRDVDLKVEAIRADDEGFARSLVISPQGGWPAVELTVRVANAIDVAGNVRETFSDRVTVARSSRISVEMRGFAREPPSNHTGKHTQVEPDQLVRGRVVAQRMDCGATQNA